MGRRGGWCGGRRRDWKRKWQERNIVFLPMPNPGEGREGGSEVREGGSEEREGGRAKAREEEAGGGAGELRREVGIIGDW